MVEIKRKRTAGAKESPEYSEVARATEWRLRQGPDFILVLRKESEHKVKPGLGHEESRRVPSR